MPLVQRPRAKNLHWTTLRAGCSTTFRAKIALDDGGALRDDQLTPASVRFLVYDREPVGYDMTNDNFNLKSSNPQSLPAEQIAVPIPVCRWMYPTVSGPSVSYIGTMHTPVR